MAGLITVRRITVLAMAALITLASLALVLPATSQSTADTFQGVTATPWPQADHLFRIEPLWLGGDGASSVDLGHGRVLWLFGDSFIADKPGETRRQSTLVHNSIAIETGYDPPRASMKFYWPLINGRPSEFAANEGDTWLWPEGGVRAGNKLLLFFVRVRPDHQKNSLGFRLVGWTARAVENPDAQPSHWALRRLDAPQNPAPIIVGSAVFRRPAFVYAFGSGPHGDFLVRWSASAVDRGDLSSLQWWCGNHGGWNALAQTRLAPALVIPDGSNEFSVQWSRRLDKFFTVESVGSGASDIGIRWAERLEGPWSNPLTVYHPPESNRLDAFVYAGKGHPELTGADLVVTYVANSSRDRILAHDMSIYYPRFVRVNFSKAGPATP